MSFNDWKNNTRNIIIDLYYFYVKYINYINIPIDKFAFVNKILLNLPCRYL